MLPTGGADILLMPLNYEFKAKTERLAELEEALSKHKPRYVGEDRQTDTYFNVPTGRLKLREGNIENTLIQYHRSDLAGAKQSDVLLFHHEPDANLKAVLTKALGVKVVVAKRRRIFFVDNVKIHFDTVDSLGTFVEVEAIDSDGSIDISKLKEQCTYYAELFGVKPEDYSAESYSDMLLKS
ncbi:MAG: adenylate cyclase [Flaviaesturariibacter sp.]|nr:adenylate cyclase [Flaviaesturariibacter sp.]